VAVLWAHSANRTGARHRLEDHLAGTAARAREFGESFGAGDLAGYVGLVHDVGKAGCAWQAGLAAAEEAGGRVGTDHKLAGTWLASRTAGMFAAAVDGHHGGLPAVAALKNQLNGADSGMRAGWEEAIERAAAVVPAIRHGPPLAWAAWLDAAHSRDPLVTDLLMRMVFSSLVDADFLDTEAHFRGQERPGSRMAAADLADRYEQGRMALLAELRPSPADGWREEVYAQAVAAAAGAGGMYRLPAPTGSGKTLAAGAFALHHARIHRLRHVVVAVPFISITEQNAQVYQRLLDRPGEGPVVLEHHSGADLDEHGPRGSWVAPAGGGELGRAVRCHHDRAVVPVAV
jgi:CRISPR-associated endonuclease/helicase Cas3